jgi:hypothetical protein
MTKIHIDVLRNVLTIEYERRDAEGRAWERKTATFWVTEPEVEEMPDSWFTIPQGRLSAIQAVLTHCKNTLEQKHSINQE